MSRGFARRRSGDEGGGAGWIYADLFLALMIVGLGSAAVTTAGAESVKPPPLAVTFRLSCKEFLIPLPAGVVSRGKAGIGKTVDEAVAAELAKRDWKTEQAKPGLVIIAGGVSEGEDAGKGDGRAQRLSPTVRASSELLKTIEFRTIGARGLSVNGTRKTVGSAGNFGLIVYLVYSGGELLENCAQ